MKTTRIALFALVLAAGAFAGARPASAGISAGVHAGPSGHARVDLGFFHDDLAAYGSWSNHSRYGQVWRPRVDRAGWRPYQYGRWAWTDYGWNWISDEPFGWATYHYGRWFDDPAYGWEWVPGNEWAPSYVSWQEGDDYIGWAPLPPAIDVLAGVVDVLLSPLDYLFVPEGRFLDRRVYDYAVPRRDCERIYRHTRNWTSYRYQGDRLFAAGVPVDRVQRAIGHRVPRYEVADLGWNPRHQPRFDGNRQPRQEVSGRRADPSGHGNRQPRQEVGGSQARQNGDQGRWNRGQREQQVARQVDRGDQGRWNRGQDRQQQGQGRWRQEQAQQQQVQRQQVQRQQRPAQNQGRWQQPQVQRQERQVTRQQNSAPRWQGRQQQPRPQQQQRANQSRGGGGGGGGRGEGRSRGHESNNGNHGGGGNGNRHGHDGRGGRGR